MEVASRIRLVKPEDMAKIMELLVEFEKGLNEIKANVEAKAKSMVKNSEDAALKAKEEAIKTAKRLSENLVAHSKEQAEKEAETVMKDADEKASYIERAIKDKMDEAVDTVIKMLLP